VTTFIKSINNLTQLIQQGLSLDPFSFELISLADISEDKLVIIKKEAEGIELIHCDVFWELTEEIYKGLMLPTISQELQQHLESLQTTSEDSVEILYELKPWTEFHLSTSDSDSTVISMQTEYAEDQIQSLLDFLNIKDTTWKDDLYDFDYKFNFESEVEALFRNIAFECWSKAKSITQSEIHATIKEANGGSHLYDLGTGEVSDSQ